MSFWKNRLDQNTTEKFDRFCPDSYSVSQLVQTIFSKRHFEINWPLGAIHKWRHLKVGDFIYPYPPLYVISHLFGKPPPYSIKQHRLWMAHYKTHVSANIAILSCCMVIISWPIRPCLVQNQFGFFLHFFCKHFTAI